MPLAERDHACETLLFDRPDEPLGIGVEIGTLRRQPNRLHTGALQDLAKDPRIEGIAVVNQMARPAQTAIDRVGQIAVLPSLSVGEESLSPNHPDTSSRF